MRVIFFKVFPGISSVSQNGLKKSSVSQNGLKKLFTIIKHQFDESVIDSNSFLTPVFAAALLAISISNLSTSAMGSNGKMMEGLKVIYRFLYTGPSHPKLVLICASISSFC